MADPNAEDDEHQLHDMTLHKRVEQSLHESEQRFRTLFNRVPIGIAQVAPTGQILIANQRFCDLLGYSHRDLGGMAIADLIPLGDRQGIAQLLADTVAAFSAAHRCLCKNGTELWVQLGIYYVRDGDPPYFICTLKDLSDRLRLEAQEQQLQNMRERSMLLQRVLNELPGAIYLVRGINARLVLSNRETYAIWGGQWEVGQPFIEFLAERGTQVFWPDGRPLPSDQLSVIVASRTRTEMRQMRQVVRTKDGKSTPITASSVPFDGALLGWTDPEAPGSIEHGALVMIQDISAQREAERIKEEFIAIATHELRSPVAVLKGYVQLFQASLQKDALTAEQIEMLGSIDAAATRLADLTDDLLDVTRLEAGKIELHVEPTDLVALARRVAQRQQILTSHHTLAVCTKADRLIALCDPLRLEQVVSNLVSNAIKYSPDGGLIQMVLRRKGQQGEAILAIRDSGIGIPPNQQADIFGRFVRADNARVLGISGSGLGLYLCRQLLDRQNGRIWFVSAPGRGTTFFLTVPLVPADSSANGWEHEMEDAADIGCALDANAAMMPLDDAYW
jgi:PAS domain S-box-containing protein